MDANYADDRLVSGEWRMAYTTELQSITSNCNNGPKVNRTVFPDAPSVQAWSGSPRTPTGFNLAWYVSFWHGGGYFQLRSYSIHTRLVRGGQPFAALTSPAAQTAASGTTATFPAFTLAASDASGQAWGGARISGAGSPEFRVNGGAWVQEAIVKSTDQITVRLTAPATGSSTATLTLRSGQTTGTANADTTNGGGNEFTAMVETFATFTANALVNGSCATVAASATQPSTGLCAAGTPTAVTGSSGQWRWGCDGQHSGTSTAANACTASYASQTLSISANPASITVNGTSAITAGSSAGLAVTLTPTGACSLSGSTAPATATGTAVGSCTVTASQAGTGDAGTERYLAATDEMRLLPITQATPALALSGAASSTLGQSITFTATLAGGTSPTGTITLTAGGAQVCTITLPANTCTAALPVGAHSITASYTGDGSNATATSSALAHQVNAASFAVAGGTATVNITGPAGCTVTSLSLSAATPADNLPANTTAPLGVLRFTATGCPTPGAVLTVHATYPAGSLAGLSLQKYGPHGMPVQTGWFAPTALAVNGDTVTYTVADNGDGDSDAALGTIADPFAPLALAPAGAQAIPTLGEWGLVLLTALLGLASLGALRRRRQLLF